VKRVAIIGSGGAGKRTLAVALGQKLGVPVLHLDAAFWQPGWVEREPENWLEWQRRAVTAPAWIMDGNYGGTMNVRLDAADTVIFLDLPPTLCVMRALLRAIRYGGRSRPDMAANCPERVDLKFLLRIWNYRRKNSPAILGKLRKFEGTRVVHLQSAAGVRAFLKALD
jgi:adenylate kinase family enzyme